MGAFQNLIEQLPGIVTRKVDRALWDRIWAISQLADNLSGGTQAQTRYVNKGGNDATGDGSFDNPFLTIQAAITSITDASAAKQYTVAVAAGNYADPFVLKPFVFVQGAGRTLTRINNTSANWIGADFAAAGALDTGLSNVGFFTSAVVVDFSAGGIASPGAGRFFLSEIIFDGVATTITGNNTANFFIAQDCENIIAGGTHTWNNINTIVDAFNARANAIAVNNTAAYAVNASRWGNVTTAGGGITITCASGANFLNITCGAGIAPNAISLVGDGAFLRCSQVNFGTTGPDAAATLRFDQVVAGATPLVTGGDNVVVTTPTANRAYTLSNPTFTGAPTRLKIFNAAAAATGFIISLTGTGLPSVQTYIPPQGAFEAVWQGAAWKVTPVVQRGKVTLTNGVSALIPADITADSSIVAFLNDINGSATTGPVVVAKPADRVVGTRAGGGGFKLTGTTNAGVTNAADNGIYDWHVEG